MNSVRISTGVVVLVSGLVFLTACSGSKSPTTKVTEIKTLENKLDALKSCGLQLAPPFTKDDLLKSWKREDYEKEGFDLVLVVLGSAEEQEPRRNHSVNVWHFDTEAIENEGDYKKIAERMVEISQGSLPLENIKDHVDIERNDAWLSFDFRGKPIKIKCEVNDDWVDAEVFGKFVELLGQSDPSKIYIYYDLGGQDGVIACVTKQEFDCLKAQGIGFIPLS
jgi:hypothetical protein